MSQQRREHRKVLKYLKGEQIIKQGDYGISIYKILSGKVQIFRKSEGVEVPLATLGPGAIIGEMAFLSKDAEVRSASAGAIEDTELEVWHPRELVKKYGGAALVKGGHLQAGHEAVDFFYDGRQELMLRAPRVPQVSSHGTGCTFSAAIAGYLALGCRLPYAVQMAKEYITQAIAQCVRIGHHQALNWFWE